MTHRISFLLVFELNTDVCDDCLSSFVREALVAPLRGRASPCIDPELLEAITLIECVSPDFAPLPEGVTLQ
jgi:hypothetical protein